MWNGVDPILKERLFGLTGPEGNHGEDVKEAYYYLDSTPTHSYLKALYKYPQAEFPYQQLRNENAGRTRHDPEFELTDSGIFDEGRYFDVQIEYAKSAPEDILVRVVVSNRGPDRATFHCLPTWWFRNTWSWGPTDEPKVARPIIRQMDDYSLLAEHETLGEFRIQADVGPDGELPRWLFTENETNTWRIDDPNSRRLSRLLRFLLDEDEFLSDFGVRSLSKYHAEHPFEYRFNGEELRVGYLPAESDSGLFGGNSNWRGPIWFPLNYLLIEALERYHQFYGNSLRVECPTRSGRYLNLLQVADEIRKRLAKLFLADAEGDRPCYTRGDRFLNDPNWRDLVLFYEYFDAEKGRGLGASHQTGWTALIAPILATLARRRGAQQGTHPVGR